MNKVYLAVDKDGTEIITNIKFRRCVKIGRWDTYNTNANSMIIPTGTIRKLIGMDLTWEDEPVELTNEMIKFE